MKIQYLLFYLYMDFIHGSTSNVAVVPIDGFWSPWSTRASPCFASPTEQQSIVQCGVGMTRRYRSCTNPTPQGGGQTCSGVSEQWTPCNTHACQLPAAFLWSSWSPCTAYCATGYRKRYTMCGTVRERLPGAIKTLKAYNSNINATTTTSAATTTVGNTTTTKAANTTTTTKLANTTTTIITTTTTKLGNSTTTTITTTTITTTTTTTKLANTTTAGNTTTAANSTTTSNVTTTTGNTTTRIITTITTTLAPTSMLAPNPNLISEEMLPAYQVGYEEGCIDNQYVEQKEVCSTWSLSDCPSPCLTSKCPFSSKCIDKSNETMAMWTCVCQLGLVMKADGSACIPPPPTTTSPRPNPSLAPPVKTAATVLTRGASFILIGFLIATIVLFALLRIFGEVSRIIHLNMEIALLCAHLCLLPPGIYDSDQGFCRVLSIAIHFFFTACFLFMLLEAVHLYSLVGWVVRKGGLLTGAQNTGVGWGGAFIIILFCMCFEYKHYGGEYTCWLMMDTPLVFGQLVPIGVMTIMGLTIIEAAGSADDFQPLDNYDRQQRTTAKVMQRTLVFILPLVFTSLIIGMLAEYGQDMALYSIFTIINGVLGGLIFFFHCSANERVRVKVVQFFKKLCGKKAETNVEPITAEDDNKDLETNKDGRGGLTESQAEYVKEMIERLNKNSLFEFSVDNGGL